MSPTPSTSHPAAAGGGDVTRLSTVTLGASGTFDVSGISGAYSDLVLILIARGTNAAVSDGLQWNFNGDTGANYYAEYAAASGTGAITPTENRGLVGLLAGHVPANTGLANSFGIVEMTIPGYASTGWLKSLTYACLYATATTTTNDIHERGGGFWNSTAALTRVQIVGATTANLAAGSQLRIYGRT